MPYLLAEPDMDGLGTKGRRSYGLVVAAAPGETRDGGHSAYARPMVWVRYAGASRRR